MSLVDTCDQHWPLIRADFLTAYGVRLAGCGLSFREFRDYLAGILADPSTRLWRALTADDDEGDDA